MMAGNPNWWSMNGMHPQSHQLSSQFVYGSSNSSIPASTSPADHHHHHHHPTQDFPFRSWSQLLLGGGGGGGEEEEEEEEGERFGGSLFQQQKKMEENNWEEQVLDLNPSFPIRIPIVVDVKQEVAQSTTASQLYDDHEEQFHSNNMRPNSNWPHQLIPVSSPTSCVTTNLTNNILNFSGGKMTVAAAADGKNHQHNQDHLSECNSTSTAGGASKKARVQQSSAQPALKVRKEKLGDRITALHQLVSPFGKTDTASVLSEAIGYIRFLQSQIEALSSPYMRNASVNTAHHHPQHSDTQTRGLKDLRSRGLCLVPISCTQNVGNDNGADYWAPAALGGGF